MSEDIAHALLEDGQHMITCAMVFVSELFCRIKVSRDTMFCYEWFKFKAYLTKIDYESCHGQHG